MSKVSVVIPCYNSEKEIKRCLDALEIQRFRDFDVILVDDFSKDSTVAVIEKYQYSYSFPIYLIRNKTNLGPSISRKIGITASSSEYIAFCDADDWYAPDFLSTMNELTVTSNADVAVCGFRMVNEDNREISSVSFASTIYTNIKKALVLNVDSLWLLWVKREIMLHIPYPDIRNGEDMAIIPLIFSKAKKIAVTDSILYNYFCRIGSASTSPSMKVVNSLLQSFNYICQNMPQEYEKEVEYIGIRNVVYGALLNLFKISFDKQKAVEIMEYFNKEYPSWVSNPYYISELPRYKFAFVFAVQRRWFWMARIMALAHSKLIGAKS